MGMAAKMVQAYLASKDTPANEVQENVLTCGWNIEGGEVRVFMFFDDDSHVHTECVNFVKVPESAYDKMYKLMNDLNSKYKLLKFVLDEKRGEIKAMDDAVISLDTCGEECFEIMIRAVGIIQDAFPEIQRTIWS